MSAIATLYYRKVKSGVNTIEEVPQRWREEVREALNATND